MKIPNPPTSRNLALGLIDNTWQNVLIAIGHAATLLEHGVLTDDERVIIGYCRQRLGEVRDQLRKILPNEEDWEK